MLLEVQWNKELKHWQKMQKKKVKIKWTLTNCKRNVNTYIYVMFIPVWMFSDSSSAHLCSPTSKNSMKSRKRIIYNQYPFSQRNLHHPDFQTDHTMMSMVATKKKKIKWYNYKHYVNKHKHYTHKLKHYTLHTKTHYTAVLVKSLLIYQ